MKQVIDKKHIIKWLHIASSMLIRNIQEDLDKLKVLNHQIENFDKMAEVYQNQVIDEFNQLMNRLEPNYVEVSK
jgi:hypothetical protein